MKPLNNSTRRGAYVVWSEKEYGVVLRSYGKMTMSQIGLLVGRNRHQVASAIRVLKGKGLIKDITPLRGRLRKDGEVWTEEDIKFLKDNFPQKTMMQIGEKIGKSRNAVSGMIFRLRKKGDIKIENTTATIEILPDENTQKRNGKTSFTPPPIHKTSKVKLRAKKEGVKTGVTILELNHDSCRWVTSEFYPQHFCGKKIEKGSFCSEHAEICYRPANIKK